MKKILVNFFIFIQLALVVSCSTSNEVAQNSFIQKRKYSSGFHFSFLKRNNQNKSVALVDSVNESSINYTTYNFDGIKKIDKHTLVNEGDSKKNNVDKLITKMNDNYSKLQQKSISVTNLNKIQTNISKNKIKYLKNKEFKFNPKTHIKEIKLKKSKLDDDKILFILLLILAFILPPLAVLLFTNIDWKKVLIATILTCLWWGPGVLYAILVLLEIL